MTRDEALAWQARWRLVGEVTSRETRQQSAADRLRTLTRLVAFADALEQPELVETFDRLTMRQR